jgi:hypothetical protein
VGSDVFTILLKLGVFVPWVVEVLDPGVLNISACSASVGDRVGGSRVVLVGASLGCGDDIFGL